MVIRFEYWENVISKNIINGATWQQAAKSSAQENLDKKDWTIVHVKQVDADTVEILKRRNCSVGRLAKWGIGSTLNVYSRVTINRNEKSAAVDRFDANYFHDAPYVGRRDLFFEGNDGRLAFVRHDLWIHKVFKLQSQMGSSWQTWSYKKAFKS